MSSIGEAIGVDLGTTNTLIADSGRVLPMRTGGAHTTLLPSVVAFLPTGAMTVGAAARRRRAIDPKNTVFSSKRIIGRPWHAYETAAFRDNYPFELRQSERGGVDFLTRAGTFSPTRIAGIIMRAALERARTDASLHKAVLGVPSEFDAAQREATRAAALDAGFASVDVIDEPIATINAYRSIAPGVRYAAVYDLGGGTFDVALVDCSTTPNRILGSGGDAYLGGDDVDRAIAQWAADQVLKTHRWDLKNDPEVFDRLLVEAERTKVRLSIASQTQLHLSQVDPAAPCALTPLVVDRGVLRDLCGELVQRTFAVCDRVLSEVGIKPADVDTVFLAGGSTKLPMVRKGVAQYFDKLPRADHDPDEVVALGASLPLEATLPG